MKFLKKKFLKYYMKADIQFPKRFERREYAFLLFNGDVMHRHISFSRKTDLLSYLKINVPAHAYYSSAYYKTPNAPTMGEKEWMGADLIFDLDADHLPNATQLTYEESLEEVKKELMKLLDFLVEDFGFTDISVYFSGGRGYHCHVGETKILSLGSHERREIVDYIMARGLDINEVIKEKTIPKGRYTDSTYEIFPEEGGWRGRIARAIISYLKKISEMDKNTAIKKLIQFEGIGEKMAMELYERLDEKRLKRIEEGKIDQGRYFKRIATHLAKKLAVSLHTEADEPVTADIKRLIRLPGSLHGKTGLKVTKVDIDKIEDFSPLRDAIVFGEEHVKIKMLKPLKIRMNEENFNLKGYVKVPEYLAVFIIGRGMGEVI